MTDRNFWICILISAAVLCMAIGIGAFLYYRGLLIRMERLLRRYQEGEWQEQKNVPQAALAETRESKLESQLHRILRQSAASREQSVKDRESLAGLLSDLSHQLKTPLANVVMDAELLQSGELTHQEQLRFSAHIEEQAKKMQWLLSALVKSSRLEHGIMQFQAELCSIRRTLAKSVSAVYAQAQEKEIQIGLEDFADRKLYHNEKWTAEAFANILENAIKYSPKGSVIRIAAQPLELYTKIDVCDQGSGVPNEERAKIFQRFYRSETVAQEEGTGLGLYLAQVILAQEKGYVTCTENPEGGSCFSVFLLNETP